MPESPSLIAKTKDAAMTKFTKMHIYAFTQWVFSLTALPALDVERERERERKSGILVRLLGLVRS